MVLPWVRSANKIFIAVLGVQLIISIIIAFYTSTWNEALFLGVPLVAFPVFLLIKFPDEVISRISVAIAVQLLTALHIQQSFGLIEMHFEIFVVMAFLSYYRDWIVIAISTAVVAVHHILFFILQSNEVGVFIFEEGHLALYILIIHALFAVAEGAVLMFIAYKGNSQAHSSMKLSSSVNEILSDGNSLDLNIELDDDNEELADFNRLIYAFRELVAQTNSVSTNVTDVSNRVAQFSKELQGSISNSSIQVNSIASATNEMSTTITQVAETAHTASDFAERAKNCTSNAKETIENSNNYVSSLKSELNNTSMTIGELSGKCERISEVMEAIKVVSEQTNLLALNAAIESARAGEHGRGFAVVADEVRQLAIKTRESVEEISEVSVSLISDGKSSVTQMESCLAMADEAVASTDKACEMMGDVVTGISTVGDNITSVATATEEQSEVSQNISESTQQLQQLLISQNENINQSHSEVESLMSNSQALEQHLAKFNV